MNKETTNFLVSGVYELGQELQRLVQDGWTLMEGSPSQHGWQFEVRMERDESTAVNEKPTQETEASDKQPATKPKGRPAKAAEDK